MVARPERPGFKQAFVGQASQIEHIHDTSVRDARFIMERRSHDNEVLRDSHGEAKPFAAYRNRAVQRSQQLAAGKIEQISTAGVNRSGIVKRSADHGEVSERRD